MIPGHLQRYLFTQYLKSIAMTLMVILLAILLIDVVEQFRTVGARTNLSLIQALLLTSFKIPELIEQTLPFIILISSMIWAIQINRHNELPVIRACGVSTWRLLLPVILSTGLIGIISITTLNPTASWATKAFEDSRTRLLNAEVNYAGDNKNSVWLRQGDEYAQTVINGKKSPKAAWEITDVTIYQFERETPSDLNSDLVFVKRIDAKKASLFKGHWRLDDAIENSVEAAPVSHEIVSLETNLDPQSLLQRFSSAKSVNFWELPGAIHNIRKVGLNVDDYLFRYHSLLAYPVLLITMSLLGTIFCFQLSRLGGLTRSAFYGVASGFLLFIMLQIISGLAAASILPSITAAWSPIIATFALACSFLAFNEDG